MTSNSLPKISIAIPSFNQGQYIEDTITSILDQGYPDVEIFVFDGGSTDSTVDVLKKYESHLTFWVSEKDKGQTDAINKGLRRATGQILAYLNSDDFFLPNALHYVAQAYQAHPKAGLYTGNGLIVDGRKENPRAYMREIGYTYESLLRGSCYLLQPSTFINRLAWEKAGEFDETLRFAMDLDYWLRVGQDFDVVLLNEQLSAWRMHEDIKTANGAMVRWNELWRLYRKFTKDQITPGLLVELFSVLQSPVISQQLGMDIRALAGQCFNTAYAEMQKTLKLRDCIPVGQGTLFKPVPPAGPTPVFRAYSQLPAKVEPAPQSPAPAVAMPKAFKPNPAPDPLPALVKPLAGQPRVDIILQATGEHAWAVGGGWETAARQLGQHHRTFRPRADWGAVDVNNDGGLFDYLANPQADILFLAGFDWHSQPLHAHPRWQDRWLQCRARKILYVQESVLNHEKLSGSKVMEHAFRRAAGLVDAIIYTDLSDRALMESVGKPAMFQPFGVDETLFAQNTPFAGRNPRAFFRGKHQPFTGQASSYQDRRALIQYLLDNQALELVPYQEKPVTPRDLAADFNRFQVSVNFPSVFSNHPTRIYEAMACGCAVVTNRTGTAEIDAQFEHGRHLLYYTNREEMLAAVRELAAKPELAARLAEQGRQEVLEKHALHRRLSDTLKWFAALPQKDVAPVGIPVTAVPSTGTDNIIIDGVIFDLQRGKPHGISRVWHRLLEQFAQSPLASRIVLLDRDGTAPVIPGIRRRTVAGYNYRQFEDDSLWMQRWCEEERAGLFVSTYHTYAEKTPTIIVLHDMIPEITGQDLSQPEWRAKNRAIDKAFAYFAVSQSTMQDFRRLYPQHAGRKLLLTPNAVGDDVSPASAEAVQTFRQKHDLRKPYFLLVGNRTLYKNAMLFFRALALLPNRQQFEVVCIGGPTELESAFKPFVRDLSCRVLRVTDGELSAAYTGAAALAYTSCYEGFGLPVLEAQKCGCPVIACRNSSLPEVAGEAAIYVGESDVAAMRTALLAVTLPDTRQRLASAGVANYQRFSWANTGQIAIQAFAEVLQTTAGRPLPGTDLIDTFRRLIFIMDQGGEATRQLAIQLRTIHWQYVGWETYDAARLSAAESRAAGQLIRLLPQMRNQFAPMLDLDCLTAYILGLEAEARRDWPQAFSCYNYALQPSAKDVLPIFNLRLGLRLARIALAGGNSDMANNVMQQVVRPIQRLLPATLDVAEEEKLMAKWTPETSVAVQRPVKKPADVPGKAPIVTAIVSTFKSERFIRGCLEDLEAQTIADQMEIIVVDSNSPQNERAVVEEFQKRYSNIVYIRTDERETVYGAWNRGARAARGKYLTNANTDDRHRTDAFEILTRTLDQNPDVSLVYSDCLITMHENETFDTGNPVGCYQWLEFNARDLFHKGCYMGPQPMWRREAHEEHGYFDAAMISAGDYEFWLRLAQNRKFLHVHETLGLYLKSPTSVEHSNRDAGARETKIALGRYQDCIINGKAPFRPRLPEPTAKAEIVSSASLKPAVAPKPVAVPAVARLGQLNEARELFGRKNYPEAWLATLTAIAKRPFHPEAYLLLAEIALAAGDGKNARICAQRARDFAPVWSAPKQFLNKSLKGNASHDWLDLSCLAPHTPRLSICLIAKNEEKFLAQCLKSVRGVAAQLIVVDTGSTDRTVEIAREFGAEIHSFAWCDDFAAARNAALEHATGDWVLMLDADEELPAAQHARLLAEMKNAAAIAYRLPLVNVGQEIEGRSFVPRLFRNAPEVFFTGRIHEQVFSSLLERAKKWGLKTALGSAELLHHGYSKELVRDRNKVERNLKLLRAALEETPSDINLLMNLGLELVRSDDLSSGIVKYREAYGLMAAQPVADLVPELREVLLTQFTSQLYKVRAYDEIVQVLTSPLARHGLTASLHLALGLAHFELKQFSEAADQMRQCLAKRKQPTLTPINTDILGAVPQHCLALCLAKLGDVPAAEKAFTVALGENGAVEAAKFDYARFLWNASRPVDALHQLHGIVTANPRHVTAWRLGAEIALARPEFLEFARDWTGEAFKAAPENPVIAAQRAEALMLNNDPVSAAGLWEKIWNCEHEPRTFAALILCEVAAGRPAHTPNEGQDEQAASMAFIEWYQKLIASRAKPMVEKINARLNALSQCLPTAGKMLQNALSEANTPVAV